MDKGQILVTIHDLRGEYAHKMSEDLKRIGKRALEGDTFVSNADEARSYYNSQAKVSVLDELLEKIANSSDETDKPKYNPFCNEAIRDSEGNEIARAKGI